MNQSAHYTKLLEYDHWANRAHLESLRQAADSSDERVIAARKAFNHVVAAKRIWYSRARALPLPDHSFYPAWSLDECDAALEEGHKLWLACLAQANDKDFDKVSAFKDTFNNEYRMSLGDILTHVALHSAHHRGQTAILLRHSGLAPADADYYISSYAQA